MAKPSQQPRPATRFEAFTLRSGPPLFRQELHTSESVRNELFASLDLYSEVKAIGKALLVEKGHTQTQQAYSQLQAYLRQGKAFFKAAELLEYRASPLSYYYAFMNLAKACMLVNEPTFKDVDLQHGLTSNRGSGSLAKHAVVMKPLGVLPLLYRHVMKSAAPANATLSIAKLLAYVSDVTFEYEQLRFGSPKVDRGQYVSVRQANGQCHAVVALRPRSGRKKFPSGAAWLQNFDIVILDASLANTMFGINAEDSRGTVFLETKSRFPAAGKGIPVTEIAADLASSFGNSLLSNPFPDEADFEVSEPLLAPRKIAMNELLAIYCIMFYLGSLVRYRPWVLEAMLQTKDAWIIERFVKSTPLTFLRHIRNALDGRVYVYQMR